MDAPHASLRTVPLFAELDDAALDDVARRVTEFIAPSGQVLIEVGQPGNGLFVLEEGTLVVDLPNGKEIDLDAGSFVGELSLLTDRPHAARVRARTDVRCLAISRADFAALLDEQPRIARAMLPVLAARFESTF